MKNILKYHYLVIGGGSGGVASARYVGNNYNHKTVALIEHKQLGGTCINLGCIPKKLTYNLSSFVEDSHIMRSYGVLNNFEVDYSLFKKNRDDYIHRLNNIYENLLKSSNVDFFKGFGKFLDNKRVQIGDKIIEAENILIAPGSKPFINPNIEGKEFCLNSDDFFKLKIIPKSVIVVGAGYIALELVHLLKTLGAKNTKLLVRNKLLKFLDEDTINIVEHNLKLNGIQQINNLEIKKVKKLENNLFEVEMTNNEKHITEMVLMATGRVPNISNLNLEKANIKTGKHNEILVNEKDETNIKNIYSIGDVTKRIDLAPVAIKAGRILGKRIFGGFKNLIMSYENIPTVIFTHPPVAFIGLNEKNAKKKYSEENINVYSSNLTPLYFSLITNKDKKEKGIIKLICLKSENDRVIGIQGVGRGMDEILQGFAVAMNLGATKSDFNDTVAIHPSVAEDIVLLDYKVKN